MRPTVQTRVHQTYARLHHSRSECLVRYPCLNFYRANRCTIDFIRLLSRGYSPRGYLAVIHAIRTIILEAVNVL